MLGIKPRAAGLEANILPLCYAAPSYDYLKDCEVKGFCFFAPMGLARLLPSRGIPV